MNVSAQTGGVSLNDNGAPPDPSSMLDIESTSKGVLFPRLTEAERDAILNPAPFLMVINTDSECLELYNGTDWISLCDGGGGGGPAPVVCPSPALSVGDAYGGGIVVSTTYANSDCGYLIVRTANSSNSASWGDAGLFGTSTAVGTGASNTVSIVANSTGTFAAGICDDETYDGFDDWFLPSLDELTGPIANQASNANIGGTCSERYWSSSENNNSSICCPQSTEVWAQTLFNGVNCMGSSSPNSLSRTSLERVRCVRAH
ncbi:MAG: hypothetical protein EA412_06665 [Chitinophagaceae bacterium]|nr:MAG: hypothetical protein EA412_06665 [Chitinophagaceae bacterium]